MTKRQLRKKRRPMLVAQARERRERQEQARRDRAAQAWRRRFLND